MENPTLSTSEKVSNPQKWLVDSGHFTFKYFERGNTVGGKDIRDHYEEIKSHIPVDDQWMMEVFVNYIKAPSIVDDFKDEETRNKWQTENLYSSGGEAANKVFETNRLKGSLIINVLGVAEAMVSEFNLSSGFDEKYADLFKEYKYPPGQEGKDIKDEDYDPATGYEKMTLDQKIVFTEKIALFAKDLYEAAAQKYMSQQ